MAICSGNSNSHCCWLLGQQCLYLEEYTVPGRHWACGLYRKYGSWEEVYKASEYEEIQKIMDLIFKTETVRCGDWPRPGETCATCGVIGD